MAKPETKTYTRDRIIQAADEAKIFITGPDGADLTRHNPDDLDKFIIDMANAVASASAEQADSDTILQRLVAHVGFKINAISHAARENRGSAMLEIKQKSELTMCARAFANALGLSSHYYRALGDQANSSLRVES